MHSNSLSPDFSFLDDVEAAGPFNVAQCFQCRKCTNGCPASFAMDLYPDQVIRLTLLGLKDDVLRSQTIWVCASCETCSTRCPNGVRIAELMDCLKEMAIKEKIAIPQPQVAAFHKTFLDNLSYTGRVFEGALIPMYMFRSGQLYTKIKKGTWRDEMQMGWKLFKKKRLALLPKPIQGKDEVAAILRKSV